MGGDDEVVSEEVTGHEDAAPGAPVETSEPKETDAQSGDSRVPSLRTILIGFIGSIAVLSLVAGTLGFWTLRTATDSDKFEARVEDLLRNEEVSDALARRIVAEVGDALALDEALDEAVPEPLKPAVSVLLAGVQSRVELQLGERLRQDRFVETVGAATGAAHSKVVRIIDGDEVIDGVEVDNGEVTVNLLPVVSGALLLFQEIGLFGDVDVPEFERGGDPDEQRAELSEALDRELPAEFGEIVVYSSDSLAEAGDTVDMVRDVLVLARRAYWVLLGLGVGLAALAIWLSVNRWRSASFMVAGLFVFTLAIRFVTGRVRDELPDAVEQPGAQATLRELASGLEQSINQTFLVVSVAALVALVATALVSSRYPRPASED